MLNLPTETSVEHALANQEAVPAGSASSMVQFMLQ